MTVLSDIHETGLDTDTVCQDSGRVNVRATEYCTDVSYSS